jgi:hypothetical protein
MAVGTFLRFSAQGPIPRLASPGSMIGTKPPRPPLEGPDSAWATASCSHCVSYSVATTWSINADSKKKRLNLGRQRIIRGKRKATEDQLWFFRVRANLHFPFANRSTTRLDSIYRALALRKARVTPACADGIIMVSGNRDMSLCDGPALTISRRSTYDLALWRFP